MIGLIEHMGDIVAAEPILRELHERHPDALLSWAIRPAYLELVESHPLLQEAIPVRCIGEWLFLKRGLDAHLVYDLHLGGKACEPCGMRVRVPSGEVTIHDYYDRGTLLDAYRHRAGLPVGPPPDAHPRLHIPSSIRRRIDALDLPGDFVALHARSNDRWRDWTDEKWRELGQRLRTRGIGLVEIGLDPVLGFSEPGYVDLCGKLTLLESAETIGRARCFVGIDSGPAHLANAVRCPGVVLLGRLYHFEGHTPYSGFYASGGAVLLRQAGGPARELPVDEVEEAVVAQHAQAREIGVVPP